MNRWKCRYVEEYLAIGEAPEQLRNCFQQRSRWCKVSWPASGRPKVAPSHCRCHWNASQLLDRNMLSIGPESKS